MGAGWLERCCGDRTGPQKDGGELTLILLAEFVGTYILMLVGCACIPTVGSAWGFGLALMMVVQIIAHISFAHVNPAISLGAYILGHIQISALPMYLIGQLLGGLAGLGTLWVVTQNWEEDTCVVGLRPTLLRPRTVENLSDRDQLNTALMEVVLTMIFMMCYAGAYDEQNLDQLDSLCLRLGFIKIGLIYAGLTFFSGSFNPIRAIAPAIIHLRFDYLYIYALAPFLGAIFGALLYRWLFRSRITDYY